MTETAREAEIPEHLSGQRLDQALARMFPEYSRSRLKAWILKGFVTVDGGTLRPRDPVRGGERVLLTPQKESDTEDTPEPIELDIVHEDDDLIVIDKRAGLVVHPGAGNAAGTLLNGLLFRFPELAEVPRAGIVHRIDKDTSGLLLIARTLQSHTALVRSLAEREISRRYLAVCEGVLTGGGTIDAPIARHPVDRVRMAVVEGGKPALTRYRVKERFIAHTYIEVELATGRTHQIRVHMAYRRHPLLGDPTYGRRLALPRACDERTKETLRAFRRQALHAAELAFIHPGSGERVQYSAPLPTDLDGLVRALRSHRESLA